VGDGTTITRLKPVPVAGGHLFRQVQTDFNNTCAVTYSGGRAFCWGDNRYGQLGIGNNTGPETGAKSTKPVAVTGGLTFRNVTVGLWHTCGVTTENRVFCWGYNHYGQLGDSSTVELRLKPTRVVGSRQSRQVDAGFFFTCAVTLAARAFCWGAGAYGQLGNGTEDKNFRYPKAVSGGLSLDRVTVGSFHACAESTGNRAYCWGHAGLLGDGTYISSLTPVAVAGGLFFSQLSAGRHTCGKTAEGRAYCWGPGSNGELGNGTTDDSPAPTPVAGPM
jgi:alpha-tubulin suppressor-like RCC1 family protein